MQDRNLILPTSLEKKIYQLIIYRLDGEKIGVKSYQRDIFEKINKGIGGFIIFGGKKSKVKKFIHEIQSLSDIPLFIASDIERGVGQQIMNATNFPCQMSMSAAIDRKMPEDVDLLEEAIYAIANEAQDIGINMPLIPVLDINYNPDNPIICTRSFSDNPEVVTWFGLKYINILEQKGLISCAKHFPGHGDTSTDSHITLPIINKSYAEILSNDIIPFKEAIQIGVSSIMVGHLSIPDIDTKPSSLSKRIITEILRGDLRFNGIVITDALNMHALKGIENVPVKCVEAGADILLLPFDIDLAVKGIKSAVKKNKIIEERIDTSLKRIFHTKERISYKNVHIDYEGHKRLSSKLIEHSITLIKNNAQIFPCPQDEKTHLIFVGDSKYFLSSPLKRHFRNISVIHDTLNLNDKIAIFVVFTTVAAWFGSSGIKEEEKNLIKKYMQKAKHSIIISFGSPYILFHFKEADVLIAAYEPTVQAQDAVLKCLKGEIEFKGKLPVRLLTNI